MSTSAATPPATVVRYQGTIARNHCGYCDKSGGKSSRMRCNFYLSAQSLTTLDYQCLVDRGWRRSGTTLYKPHNALSCCPQYTIRLKASTFKPTRDQRNTLHRWTRYVLGEEYIKEASKKYPKSKEEKKRQKNEFDLAENVHAPEYASLQGRTPPEPEHRFEVTLEPAEFSKEKYEVYRNYQIHVHHDEPHEVTERGFRRFLCDSPLVRDESNPTKKLGSYHQVYRLDGRVFALGVLDLMPDCVSGVYFAYHSDFEKHNLGKVSACREACLAAEGEYGYYYMGLCAPPGSIQAVKANVYVEAYSLIRYYIASCVKMRYKGAYGPSELMDPATNTWNPLDDTLKTALSEHHYFSPSDAAKGIDEDERWSTVADPYKGEKMMDPGFIRESRMPGLMSPEEVEKFSVGNVLMKIGKGEVVPAWMIRKFEDRKWAVRILIEETVAAVGPEVAGRCIVDFS